MRSRKLSLVAIPLALLTSLAPASATTEVTPTSPVIVVNNGPGDQTDGHVSGDWVAYTNSLSATNEIRYHNLVTGSDAAIPSNGASDFLSDISGTLVAFTRVTDHSAIMTFDVSQPTLPPVELAPQAGSNRRYAQIGGRTVAWVDYGFNASALLSEIVTYDLDTKVATRLTNDTMLDWTPAVSPDGSVVVWAKCSTTGTGCQIWQAVRNTAGSWVTSQLTLGNCQNFLPDSNGQIVAYAATCNGEADIYWQPVGGGPEHRLVRPGAQQHPTVSGSVIAFETYNGTTLQWDIDAYDTATDTLYHVANSLGDKSLPDVSIGTDGLVRVVWTACCYDVYARKFSTSLTPAQRIGNLITLVQGMNIDPLVKTTLVASLQQIQTTVTLQDITTTCTLLNAFIAQVGAQSGVGLTVDQANQILTVANAVKLALPC